MLDTTYFVKISKFRNSRGRFLITKSSIRAIEVEVEMEVEGEVEVEERRGRIEYKVVEQLKRWSSKHRPNYLTFCTSPTRCFAISLFSFSFFQGGGGKECLFNPVGRQCRYLLRRRREEFDCYMYYTRICMCFIDNSSSTRRRRRSGVLRISSEEIDKKLMYLE